MAEALGAAGSIAGIVSFGLQLATTLQTYIETMLEAEERLRDITFDINSTASALRQLQDIIDNDKMGTKAGKLTPKVFKDEGRREIEAIAQKCGKVYGTIVLLVNKAGNLDPNSAAPPASEVLPLKVSSLTRMMKWPWVEPHIKRCQEQLRWLKMSLLFNLQLASLARLQLGTHDKTTGEDEIVIRKMVVFLRRNEINAARALTRNPEKRQAATSPSSSSSTSSYSSAHVLSKSLISQSLPENTKPSEKPVGTFYRSFNPGTEKVSHNVPASEKENSPINTENIFQFNMIQQSGTLYTPSNVPSANGFHQPEKNARNLRHINTRISEEQEEPLEAIRDITNKVPEHTDAPKREPEILLDISNATKDDQNNVSKQLMNQQVTSPPVTREASSTRENGLALALATSIQKSRSTVSGTSRIKQLPSWLKEIFSPHGDSYDWESETIEAFVLLDIDSSDIIKVPFGDRGLRRLKRKLEVSWDKYASLDSDQHQRVDKAILHAKLLDARERICLGIGIYPRVESDTIFVFFSLGDHLEPIHFTDFLGRDFKFPVEFFRIWDKSNQDFIRLFQHMKEVGWYVSDGCYDILDEGGNILMPHAIKSSVEPGSRLSMRMWSKPEINHELLMAEKEAIQKSKSMATYLAIGEGETDEKKQVVKFKDALGRIYVFPFHRSKTWDGISELITQAFLNIQLYASHVAEGHYDLLGPDNCRILPPLWDVTIQPGWSILMCLWPKPEYPSDILVPWHIFPSSSAPLSRRLDNLPQTRLDQDAHGLTAGFSEEQMSLARQLKEDFEKPKKKRLQERLELQSQNSEWNSAQAMRESPTAGGTKPDSPTIRTPQDIMRDRVKREARKKEEETKEGMMKVRAEGEENTDQDFYLNKTKLSKKEKKKRESILAENHIPNSSESYFEGHLRPEKKFKKDYTDFDEYNSSIVGGNISVPNDAFNNEVDWDAPKKSRRLSTGFDDNTNSEPPNHTQPEAPVQDSAGETTGDGKDRKKKTNGFFGLFGSKSGVSVRDETSGGSFDDMEAEKKSRRSKIHGGSSLYGDEGDQVVDDHSHFVSNEHRSHRLDKEERSPNDSEKEDSFLANAGILGAAVGLAGAAAAIAHQQSKVEDEEIERRHYRPSIDPQYGDLLPLPPSSTVTPTSENFDEYPSLPESRPQTPKRNWVSAQRTFQETPLKSPSHSAVPIILKIQKGNKTSWDSTKEYRPLYLVESQGSEEEHLPSLPPSSQFATSDQQHPHALTLAETVNQPSRKYSSDHNVQSVAHRGKDRVGVPAKHPPVRLAEVLDEVMPPPRMSPQFSGDSWASDSDSGTSEKYHLANSRQGYIIQEQEIREEHQMATFKDKIRNRPTQTAKTATAATSAYVYSTPSISPLSDEDIDLDLDIEVDTEVSIGELLGRYTNATDTSIGMDE